MGADGSDTEVKLDPSPKFLGIRLDKNVTMVNHFEHVLKKVGKRLAVLARV